MNRFLKRLIIFILIGIVPFAFLLIIYLCYDPFQVIKSYDDYSEKYINTNRDYISTAVFLNNYKKYNYNSFIFGSSRTLAYKPDTWRKYLSDESVPYMFDASGESIYGIYTKLKFLKSLDVTIKNVLIILDVTGSFYQWNNHKGHLYIKHPATSGESKLGFHFVFYKAFLTPDFLVRLLIYLVIREHRQFMYPYLENRKMVLDTISNAFAIVSLETEIQNDPVAYYLKHKNLFYERNGETIDSRQQINQKQLFMLQEVKRILEKNGTNYKVIISPLYDQVKFSIYDINILRSCFGNNLYDFSGENALTEPVTNYYEPSHYKPQVGDTILKYIYNH